MRFHKSGTTGWALLTLFVFGWDFWVAHKRGGETLSHAFKDAAAHPLYRWPVALAWLLTTLHLFGWVPEKVDPYKVVGRYVSRF